MNRRWERLYAASPLWAQQAAILVFGWYWKHRRLGRTFHRLVQEYVERESWSVEQLRAYVEVRLREQVLRAWHESPYYRQRFAEHGITETQLEHFTLADLPRLPLLERNVLRTQPKSLLTRSARMFPPKSFYSSGTTGVPARVYMRRLTHQHNMAVREARCFRWAGVSLRSPRAVLGAKMIVPSAEAPPPYWRYNRVERQLYLSLYHISLKNIPDYVKALNRFPPVVLEGLPSGLYFMARFIREAGLEVHRPQAIITMGEKLEAHMRAEIEAVFGARTWEEYGSLENCVLATECEHGRMHVHLDFGILELIGSDGQSVRPGEIGEAVVTGLANRDQILIRLRLGDLAAWAPEACPCGRNQFPPLADLYGRVGDTIVLPDGRRMVVADVFGGLEEVWEGQLIQQELDKFLLLLVPTAKYSERCREVLEERMRQFFGAKVRYEIREVNEIPPGPGGKKRRTVCLLAPELTGPVCTNSKLPDNQ